MQLINHGDLAIACRNPNNRIDLARGRIVPKLRPVNVLGWDDVFERRLNHFFRRRRDYIEREAIAVNPVLEESRQLSDVLLEADSFAHLDQMLLADAAVFRIVQEQVRQFATLLYQVDVRQSRDLVTEPRVTKKLTQNDSCIVEAQGLIKVTVQQIMFGNFRSVSHRSPLVG